MLWSREKLAQDLPMDKDGNVMKNYDVKRILIFYGYLSGYLLRIWYYLPATGIVYNLFTFTLLPSQGSPFALWYNMVYI